MNKIIFFDIDGTLFDANVFIESFYKSLSAQFGLNDQDFDEINKIYRDIKNEYGYFVPNVYLERINESFPSVDPEKLKSIFWGENIPNSLFSDNSALVDLSTQAKIAFFSKGEEAFQREKIRSFSDKFDEVDVYIFSEKLDKFDEVFSKYKSLECFLVDDNINVLESAKSYDPSIRTILIDRRAREVQNENVDFKIESLSDIMPILNETR